MITTPRSAESMFLVPSPKLIIMNMFDVYFLLQCWFTLLVHDVTVSNQLYWSLIRCGIFSIRIFAINNGLILTVRIKPTALYFTFVLRGTLLAKRATLSNNTKKELIYIYFMWLQANSIDCHILWITSKKHFEPMLQSKGLIQKLYMRVGPLSKVIPAWYHWAKKYHIQIIRLKRTWPTW